MIYNYFIRQGVATLSKMSCDGSDIDIKPKKIGKYKTDAQAKSACQDHYMKACKIANAARREEPRIIFS